MRYKQFVMEQHLGRRLASGECVRTIDHDELNTHISNLRLKSTTRTRKPYDMGSLPDGYAEATCTVCGKPLLVTHFDPKTHEAPTMHKTCVPKYLRQKKLAAKAMRIAIAEAEGTIINPQKLTVRGVMFKRATQKAFSIDTMANYPSAEAYYAAYEAYTAQQEHREIMAEAIKEIPFTLSETVIVRHAKAALNITGVNFINSIKVRDNAIELTNPNSIIGILITWE
jgi:hypothetical protein